jgi:acyl-CoA thioester hydrolase
MATLRRAELKECDMISVSIPIKIQFYHLDPMGIVWHGRYLEYFEQARCELLDKIGYNYNEMHNSGYVWPIVDVHLKYVRSIRFLQEIMVTATLTEYENRLKVKYLITDKNTGEKLTKGTTIQVAVDIETQEMSFVSPEILQNKVRCLVCE